MGRLFDNRELSSKKSHPNTQKVNSRRFKLHSSFSNSLDLSNAGDLFQELNPKGLYLSSQKEKENRTLSCVHVLIKREIGKFHVVVVQRRQKNVQKRVVHVQSCCFASFFPFSLTSPLSLPKLPIMV